MEVLLPIIGICLLFLFLANLEEKDVWSDDPEDWFGS